MSFPPTEPLKSGLDIIRTSFQPFIDAGVTLNSTVTGEVINSEVAVLQTNRNIVDGQGNKILSCIQ